MYRNLFIVICFVSCSQEPVRKSFILSHDAPYTQAIYLKNNGSGAAEFTMKLNGFFPSTLDEISDSIQKIPNSRNREDIVRKTWFFVSTITINSSPLSQGEWYHSPELIVNSTGFGICDDRAVVLARLWNHLGYRTKVWSLNGHVVPEVYANGKWQMFDPHFGIFFPGPDGLATGVQELASCSELFNNYFSIDSARALFFRIRKKAYIKNITSVTDNYELQIPVTANTVPDFNWILPAGAELTFPGKFSGEILSGFVKSIYRYAQLKVTLIPSQSQEIIIPLTLYAVNGSGHVMIRGKKFLTGSGALDDEIRNNGCFNEKIAVSNPHDTLTLLFFINPVLSRLHTSNLVFTSGYGLTGISANLKWIPEEERVKYYLEDTVHLFLEKNQKYILLIDSIKNRLPQHDSDLFVHLTERYVSLIPGLDDREKIEKTRNIKERYSFFKGIIGHTNAYKEFKHILNDPAVALVAIKILETNTTESINREFSKYAYLIENYKPDIIEK